VSYASTSVGWREERRRSAREAIVDAAWELARKEGLAAFSLRDLARRVGITTPTVYAYFDSKKAIYDAMFSRAATEFAAWMTEPYDAAPPLELLVASLRRFAQFCESDIARYQLLFQRTIPEFEPSPESYAPAVRTLDVVRELLAVNGITQPKHLDLWTALVTGLVDQQVSNDPGGDRWTRLSAEAVAMFVTHCQSAPEPRKRAAKSSRPTGSRP
jgi:AcrR family transcriptional regulator